MNTNVKPKFPFPMFRALRRDSCKTGYSTGYNFIMLWVDIRKWSGKLRWEHAVQKIGSTHTREIEERVHLRLRLWLQE